MALSRGAAGGSRTVPWGPNLKENGASLYGHDSTKNGSPKQLRGQSLGTKLTEAESPFASKLCT